MNTTDTNTDITFTAEKWKKFERIFHAIIDDGKRRNTQVWMAMLLEKAFRELSTK